VLVRSIRRPALMPPSPNCAQLFALQQGQTRTVSSANNFEEEQHVVAERSGKYG
jgi:hypothetical protein